MATERNKWPIDKLIENQMLGIFKCTSKRLSCWCCHLVLQLRDDLQELYRLDMIIWRDKCETFTFEDVTVQITVRHWSSIKLFIRINCTWLYRHEETGPNLWQIISFEEIYLYNYIFCVYQTHIPYWVIMKMRSNVQYIGHNLAIFLCHHNQSHYHYFNFQICLPYFI